MRGGLRPVELGLLAFPPLTLTVGLLALRSAQGSVWTAGDSTLIALLALALLVAHGALVARAAGADQVLLPSAGMLMGLGVLAAARLAPALAPRQALWVLVGAGALVCTLVAVPRVDWLARYRYTWLVLGILLLVATLVFGIDPNDSGSRLWLGTGDLSFQPSEILKILACVFLAAYLAEKRMLIAHAPTRVGPLTLPPLAYLGPLLAAWGLSLMLLVWQRDLGAALLFYLVFVAFLYVTTGRSYVVTAVLLLCLGGALAYGSFEHVQLRTKVWLDPWPYASDEGYQIVQALTAYAAGGVIGSGLGLGFPDYVPAVHTDFVLAALAEELGLVGSLGVVGLYMVLVHRIFRIALRARSEFAMLLSVGLGATLGMQAIVIMAANLRLMPITGITLPFLSYGGSSLLANMVMLGLLLRVSAEAAPASRSPSGSRSGDGLTGPAFGASTAE